MASFGIENIDEPNDDLQFFIEKIFVDTDIQFRAGVSKNIIRMPSAREFVQQRESPSFPIGGIIAID